MRGRDATFGAQVTAATAARAFGGSLSDSRRRSLRHAFDFVRAAVSAQIRTEFQQYFLGWLWWILEPVTSALTFFFIVFLFFHLPGDRLWLIMVSVVTFRWFSRSVDIAAHLAPQFAPFVRTGGVSTQLLFNTFLIKETVVFVIALGVIFVPVAIWAHPFSPNLVEVPLIVLAQAMVIYWASALSMVIGGLIHDVGKVVGLLVSILFYFSPGLYIRTDTLHLPAQLRMLLEVNPFWGILTSWQNVLVRGQPVDFTDLGIWMVVSLALCVLTTMLIARTRRALTLAQSE
jgi:lipopolysaccharide transport system permease protein